MTTLKVLIILFIIATSVQCHKWPPKNKVLHIGGIFPINGTEGWQGGMVTPAFQISLYFI